MKELVKPQSKSSDDTLENQYEALDEGGCSVDIDCFRCTTKGFADDDQEDIIF